MAHQDYFGWTRRPICFSERDGGPPGITHCGHHALYLLAVRLTPGWPEWVGQQRPVPGVPQLLGHLGHALKSAVGLNNPVVRHNFKAEPFGNRSGSFLRPGQWGHYQPDNARPAGNPGRKVTCNPLSHLLAQLREVKIRESSVKYTLWIMDLAMTDEVDGS